MSSVLAALILLAPAVVVEGASECPTPAAVEERLRPLLPPGRASADVAQLSAEPAGLRITLRRADGAPEESKTIAGAYSCDELADAVAVMLAAWQADGASRELVAPPPPVVVAPAPPAVVAPAAAPAPRPHRWELGAGAGGSLAGGTLAAAGLVSVGLGLGDRLGLTLRGSMSGNRELALSGGTARWWRALVTLGPRVSLAGARARADAHLGAGVSWLSIAARGFDNPRSHDDVVFAVTTALRATWTRRGVQPWLEGSAAWWPGRSLLSESPGGGTAALPRLEILLALGASFSL